jgi:tetratricopeptide (TPR) repeat protein
MGVVNMLRNEYEVSLIAFKKALELNPNLAIAYMWQSISLTELQRFDEAIVALQKSRELDPLFLTNNYNLGILLTWQGQYEEAEAIFDQLRVDFPDSAFAYVGAAGVYNARGNFAGAIEQWKLAVDLSPDNADFKNRLLTALSSLGLTDIIKSLGSNSDFESTILIFDKQFDALFEKMQFEVEANPDDYWTAFSAGWYHAMFGDKQKAFTLITENESTIDDIDKYWMPDCMPAIEIAWAYQQMNMPSESQVIIDRCMALVEEQRSEAISRQYLDYLEARIYSLNGEDNKALDALANAIDNGLREWWVKHDPLLENIRNKQGYIELIKVIEDDLEQQRQQVRALFLLEP